MKKTSVIELKPESLRKKTTAEEIGAILAATDLEPSASKSFVGLDQQRFLKALEIGLSVPGSTHNIFVSGFYGSEAPDVISNKAREVLRDKRSFLESECEDWIYLYNFDNPACPRAISLPKGGAKRFKLGLCLVLGNLKIMIPENIANSPDIAAIEISHREFLRTEEEKLIDLARKCGLIMEVNEGVIHYRRPNREEIEKDEEIKKAVGLTADELGKLKKDFDEAAQDFFKNISSKTLSIGEEIRMASLASAGDACKKAIGSFKEAFAKEFGDSSLGAGVLTFLDELQKHSAENYGDFMTSVDNANQPSSENPPRKKFLPWEVNVFIDNSGTEGVPIIVENDPTLERLAGKIKVRVSSAGGMIYITDHTEIQAGALARANGGCLVLNIMDFSWDAFDFLLKSLKNREIEIQDIYSLRGVGSISNLTPEPIPLNIRVILCGPTWLWHELYSSLPRFKELFSVRADILPELNGSENEIAAHSLWMRGYAKRNVGCDLSDAAIGKLIEYGHRLANSQIKLSTDFRSVMRIIKEASFLVQKDSKEIGAALIDRALREKFWRSDYIYEKIQQWIADGTTLVSVSGRRVGGINCLAVYDYGDIRFASPALLTVSVSPSSDVGFIGIDRKVELGGKILGKAEEIIRGWFKSVFGLRAPLSFAASTSFEQIYDGIEGDSATLGEVYGILSAISRVPIYQGIAITGSMNQLGEVQPIGGVNEKIEGFFDVCRAIGKLNGRQGVIIPRQNVKNLMLREDVIEAVSKGKFHIWPVKYMTDCAPILMGIEFGRNLSGKNLKGLVVNGLKTLHEKSAEFYARNGSN